MFANFPVSDAEQVKEGPHHRSLGHGYPRQQRHRGSQVLAVQTVVHGHHFAVRQQVVLLHSEVAEIVSEVLKRCSEAIAALRPSCMIDEVLSD
jgi:hypothetical protein